MQAYNINAVGHREQTLTQPIITIRKTLASGT